MISCRENIQSLNNPATIFFILPPRLIPTRPPNGPFMPGGVCVVGALKDRLRGVRGISGGGLATEPLPHPLRLLKCAGIGQFRLGDGHKGRDARERRWHFT